MNTYTQIFQGEGEVQVQENIWWQIRNTFSFILICTHTTVLDKDNNSSSNNNSNNNNSYRPWWLPFESFLPSCSQSLKWFHLVPAENWLGSCAVWRCTSYFKTKRKRPQKPQTLAFTLYRHWTKASSHLSLNFLLY